MPFTPAHVMAVLPGVHWRRLRLDPTCLVIGSMAPDFEYFARGEQVSTISHTLVGLFVWCLPVTLVLAALYHRVVKWPALLAGPRAAFRLAHTETSRWSWRLSSTIVVVLSALLGAATHLGWDAVTHANTFMVRRFPSLEDVYVVPVLGTMALHRILQHASTLVGLVVGAGYLVTRLVRSPAPRRTPDRPERWRARWTFALCFVIGLAMMALRIRHMNLGDPGSVIAASITGLLGGTLLASLVLRAPAQRLRDQLEGQP